ncbi:hypothetical protein OIU84_000357 [Salix udensis]|uniref:Endonuclease/exonuclease/phosphatase domain-containing protein n=1 Tax=Salix udensis TaxID=889485 RepID=A0AAD6PLY5_9ROSI|nr:hypothetical protein OIU84_000357 [Salix udensis]
MGTWNIRGLNNPNKQRTIQQWINKNSIDLMGILEPRIRPANMEAVESGLGLSNWRYSSNTLLQPLCRIMICWNPQRVAISNIILDSQWITCDVESKQRGGYARVTFVYGHNSLAERIALWNYLSQQQTVNGSCPWMVTGDFNAIMHPWIGMRGGQFLGKSHGCFSKLYCPGRAHAD